MHMDPDRQPLDSELYLDGKGLRISVPDPESVRIRIMIWKVSTGPKIRL
jgi:hypothetical protein